MKTQRIEKLSNNDMKMCSISDCASIFAILGKKINELVDANNALSEKEGEPHLYPMCKHGVVKTVDCEKCLPQEPKQVDVVDRILKEIVKREEAYHFSQENLKKYREFREIIRIALD